MVRGGRLASPEQRVRGRAALPLPPAASAAPEKGCKSLLLLLLLSAPGASRRAAEPAPSSVGTQSPDPPPSTSSPPQEPAALPQSAFGVRSPQPLRCLCPSVHPPLLSVRPFIPPSIHLSPSP